MATAPPRQILNSQTGDDVTIDTGDGSLFGVPEPVSETPTGFHELQGFSEIQDGV